MLGGGAAKRRGHPEPGWAEGNVALGVLGGGEEVMVTVYMEHGWGGSSTGLAKVLQGGSSSLNHHVFQWPKKTTRPFWMSYRPWAARFGRFLACQHWSDNEKILISYPSV